MPPLKMTSPIAKRLTGTYIADSVRPVASMVAWAQEECRNGVLRPLLNQWVEAQEENLDASLLLVERIEGDGIVACLPFCLMDHESPHPFQSELWLKINPLTRAIERLPQAA